MDILTIIISAALGLGALALILHPLWQPAEPLIVETNETEETFEAYQVRYQAALDAIRDLKFDYEMDKVTFEDYERLLHKAKLEAAKIRQELDHLSKTDASASLDEKIEGLVTQVRRDNFNDDSNKRLLRKINAEIRALAQVKKSCPQCDHPIKGDDAFCRECGYELKPQISEKVCPKCGHHSQPDDSFCAKCGSSLT